MFSTGAGIGMLGGGAALDKIHFTHDNADCAWAVLFWITGPIVTSLVVAFMFTIKEPNMKIKYTKPVDALGTNFYFF